MTRHALAASTALAAALFFTTAAQAQADQTPGVPPAAPNSAQADQQTNSQPAADPGAVQEIVVTATRRETNLQKTPIAVSAFGQAALDRQQVRDVTDLVRFVPSFAFNQQGDQQAITLTLRGIGNDSAFTEVADPEVAIYVDGIYSPRAQGAVVLFYDMERAEVLRGPQGTLFGRNATVGALSLITAKPTLDRFYGNVEAIGGNYSRFGVRGAINVPVTDTLAVRLAFVSDRHDGYADYQDPPVVAGVDRSAFVRSGKKYYAGDQQSARLSLLWKPSDRFTWNINGEYYKDTGAPVIGLLQTARAGEKRWSTLSDTAPEENRHSYNVRSTMDYDITDGVQVSYIAGYQKIGGTANSDADGGALPPVLVPPTTVGGATTLSGAFDENRTASSSFEFQSHELQLKSTGEQDFDWILGAYYSHEKNAIRFDVDLRNGYRDGTFSWAGSFIQRDREIDSMAGFAQGTYHLGDSVRLTGGLRYTQDKKEDIGGRNVTFAGTGCTPADSAPGGRCTLGIFGAFTGVTAEQLVTLLPGYGISNNDVKGKWHKLTYLGRADADLAPGILGYASVSSGFKSGTILDGGRTASPETLTNYEVGVKSKLFNSRATLNVAAYYSDFKDYQVNQVVTTRNAAGVVTSSQLETDNANGAKSYGIEAELVANLSDTDRLQFAGTVQKTKLDSLLNIDNRVYDGGNLGATVELKGNELPHAPRFSGTVVYEHDFELANGGSITPRATTHYETRSFLSYFNGNTNPFVTPATAPTQRYGVAYDEQKAYFKSDFSIRYSAPDDKYLIEAFVLNIEDKRIKTGTGSQGAPSTPVFLSVLQPPRTFGVRVKAAF